MTGEGASQDDTRALGLFERACNGGEMRACDNLGIMYESGKGVAEDLAYARTLFQRACEGGLTAACRGR